MPFPSLIVPFLPELRLTCKSLSRWNRCACSTIGRLRTETQGPRVLAQPIRTSLVSHLCYTDCSVCVGMFCCSLEVLPVCCDQSKAVGLRTVKAHRCRAVGFVAARTLNVDISWLASRVGCFTPGITTPGAQLIGC